MYYLRTKSAVDAIKFTLNNDKKAQPVQEAVAVAAEPQALEVTEFQAMLERSRNAAPDDCEMCGS
ncbi:hypothetical protein VF12_37865 [Nostoc linckia z15]|nr:hypothetical protein VF12_37865 [Nostoc linckia z15]